jgi:hypothetical protein
VKNVRRWISGAVLAGLGVSLLVPTAASAYPCGGYYRPYYRAYYPVRPCRRVVVRQNNCGSSWPGFLLGAVVGAGVGYAVDHRVWEDRDRDRDCDDEECPPDYDDRKPRYERVPVPEKAPTRAPEPEPAPVPAPGPEGSLGLADRPVRVGDFRVEPLAGGRLKIAWLGDDYDLRAVELFTTGGDRRVLQRERVYEFPFAATFEAPARDGFLGVTLLFRSGETVTRMLPVTELQPGARRPVRDGSGT